MSLYNSHLGFDKTDAILSDGCKKVHFIGILGISMYSLAKILKSMGHTVSGSDRGDSDLKKGLLSIGIAVSSDHDAKNISDADLVVYSLSIDIDNPEYIFALKNKIPIISRAELLGYIMMRYDTRIGVCGSHGKSTTTAILTHILSSLNKAPTALCGAQLSTKEPILLGEKELFVFEACEYKDSFLSFYPSYLAILNIDLDHIDYYSSSEEIYLSFLMAANKAEYTVINTDDILCRRLKDETLSRTITFGSTKDADYRYEIVERCGKKTVFNLYYKGEKNRVDTSLLGEFNVQNITAAIAVCNQIGISVDESVSAIDGFKLPSQRQEYLGKYKNASVYRDYAHHPREILAVISAFKQKSEEALAVIFKPHTFSRTKAFLKDFAAALSLADRVIVLDIYPARESDTLGLTKTSLSDMIGEKAVYLNDDKCADFLKDFVGNVVIMGAGNTDIVNKSFQK